MKRIVLVFLILLITDIGFSQENKDIIEWNNKMLTWKDFQGSPLTSSNFIAVSAGKISVFSTENIKPLTNEIHISIKALFYKKKSWSITTSAEILKHEQLHTDIRELYARLIRKRIIEKAGEFTSFENAKKITDKIYSELDNSMRMTQGKYDDETNHSVNKKQQKEWECKVAKQLEELNDYSDTEIIITIKR